MKQLHADIVAKDTKFTSDNETVYENFLPDGMIDYIDLYRKLLDNDVPILLYVGNMDVRDGPYGVQEWMKKLKWKYIDEFHASSRYSYHYKSYDNGEIRLGGNYKQHKNLSLLMVYNAGHLVPSTQLAASRSMLKDMLDVQKLQCHKEGEDCSLDEVSCKYLNNCNGHGK